MAVGTIFSLANYAAISSLPLHSTNNIVKYK
nr:MAG TPA: hypothetical protein [Caudoviricetes sp.]